MYGRLPLMLTEHCLNKPRRGACRPAPALPTDRAAPPSRAARLRLPQRNRKLQNPVSGRQKRLETPRTGFRPAAFYHGAGGGMPARAAPLQRRRRRLEAERIYAGPVLPGVGEACADRLPYSGAACPLPSARGISMKRSKTQSAPSDDIKSLPHEQTDFASKSPVGGSCWTGSVWRTPSSASAPTVVSRCLSPWES